MRDDRCRHAEGIEEVETVEPSRILADLVDLVDGDCVATCGECGRRCQHDGGTVDKPLTQHGSCTRGAKLSQAVARTARSGEEVVAPGEGLEEPPAFECAQRARTTRARDLEWEMQAYVEVLLGLGDEFVGVLLEAEGCIEEDRPWWVELGEELAMDRDHRRSELAGSKKRKCTMWERSHDGVPTPSTLTRFLVRLGRTRKRP